MGERFNRDNQQDRENAKNVLQQAGFSDAGNKIADLTDVQVRAILRAFNNFQEGYDFVMNEVKTVFARIAGSNAAARLNDYDIAAQDQLGFDNPGIIGYDTSPRVLALQAGLSAKLHAEFLARLNSGN